MTQPLVAVLLPTYNQAAFVADAVLSAVEQDYPNLRVVVCDDGSTDGTVEVIRSLQARYPGRIVAIVDEPHLGLTGNCNRNLRACVATGATYVAFHAGDDIWLPGKITRQVEWLEADPRRVLCSHDVEVFDSDTNARLFLWSEQHQPARGSDPALFVSRWPAWHPLGNVVRASVLPPGGYDERVPIASDFKFFVHCVARGGEVGDIPGVFARYRQWAGNASAYRPKMWSDLFNTLDLIAAEYPSVADACRSYRALSLYQHGRELLYRGDAAGGRACLMRALRERPWSSRTVPALLAVIAPTHLTYWAVALRRRLRSSAP